MESYGTNFNSYNGQHVGHSQPNMGPIKFESEPYHAVENGASLDYSYGADASYGITSFQKAFEQEYKIKATVVSPPVQGDFYNHDGQTAEPSTPTFQPSGNTTGYTPVQKPQASTGQHTCDICQKVFGSHSSLMRHKETHSGVKKFSCDLCGNSYTQKHNLTKHLRLHTGEKPYQCEECDKTFYIHHHLKHHMVQHTGHYPYTCAVCQRGFRHRSKLDKHTTSHHSAAPGVAVSPGSDSHLSASSDIPSDMSRSDDSEKDPETEKDDDNHDTTEDAVDDAVDNAADDTVGDDQKDGVLECEVCQQVCVDKKQLDNHMKMQHSFDREFKCDYCSSIFLTRAHLVRHRKSHTGETIFECDECNMSFRWKVSLHIHKRRHNNDYKRHECRLCNKYFLLKESLRRHMAGHVAVTIYRCDECGDKFTQKARYESHQQVHADDKAKKTEKPVVEIKGQPTCKTCHKTFSTNSSLRKHEYTHMAEKPHKCLLCNVSFAQKIQLRLHNKRHNGGKMDPPLFTVNRKKKGFQQKSLKKLK